jgi:hypothetical protein
MSEIARWSYKNTAQVKPFVSEDGENGGVTFGTEYQIACSWTAEAKEYREAGAPAGRGIEFVSNYVIFTEDARPGYRDQILINSPGVPWQEIRARTNWDMSPFDDTPDYKLVT